MPISLGGTIAVLAAAPGLATIYAWVAVIGIPIVAVPACAALLTLGRAFPVRVPPPLVLATVVVVLLLTLAWTRHGQLVGEAAAVAVTALSACTLASYLAALAPVPWLRVGVVTMAVLDAILVFGQLLQGPNHTLEIATPGAHLPHLQVAAFGSAVIGYGDLFIAAVLGNIIARDDVVHRHVPRWQAAFLLLGCAAAFDLLFLRFDVLPATVPVAVAMLALNVPPHRKPALPSA
jgi:hypothetical protein